MSKWTGVLATVALVTALGGCAATGSGDPPTGGQYQSANPLAVPSDEDKAGADAEAKKEDESSKASKRAKLERELAIATEKVHQAGLAIEHQRADVPGCRQPSWLVQRAEGRRRGALRPRLDDRRTIEADAGEGQRRPQERLRAEGRSQGVATHPA